MRSLESRIVGAHPLSVAVVLFIVGQAALILLAPLSRATTADSIYGGAVFLSPDSYGYLANGATWSGVAFETWNRWAFLSVVRIGEYLGSGAIFLVLVQAVLTVLAAAALYDLGRRYSGTFAGYLAASAVLLNPMVSQWIRFIHTEALFYSFVILAVWSAERVVSGRGGEFSLLAVAVAVTMTRPNGVLVGAACLTAFVLSRLRAPLRGIAVLLVWGTSAGALVAGLNDATPRYGWDTAAYTVQGVVIEGADHVRTAITMPQPERALASNHDLIDYAVKHPIAVGRLAIARIWTETIQIRRHYPSVVNRAVGLFMLGYLSAAAVGLVMLARTTLTKASILVALPLMLLIGGTFAVAEGRFGWAYLVAFAVHAGTGASRAMKAVQAFAGRISHPRPGRGLGANHR